MQNKIAITLQNQRLQNELFVYEAMVHQEVGRLQDD
jgi:hypothetical protein